jgi:hypothetical protein
MVSCYNYFEVGIKAKYIFKMIEQLKEKYGFNFNVETFEEKTI